MQLGVCKNEQNQSGPQVRLTISGDVSKKITRIVHNPKDRRSALRFTVNAPVQISTSAPAEYSGTLVDYSQSGLGIELDFALSRTTELLIQLGTGYLLGVVRHCKPMMKGGFRVGIALQNLPANRCNVASLAWGALVRRV